MSPVRNQTIQRLLQDVLDCDPAERSPFLERACGGDAELRAEVESLLAHTRAKALAPGANNVEAKPAAEPDLALPEEAFVAERGEEIYQSMCSELEREGTGRVVAIEVASGCCYVGEDELEAYQLASAKHPDRRFYFRWIGTSRLPWRLRSA